MSKMRSHSLLPARSLLTNTLRFSALSINELHQGTGKFLPRTRRLCCRSSLGTVMASAWVSRSPVAQFDNKHRRIGRIQIGQIKYSLRQVLASHNADTWDEFRALSRGGFTLAAEYLR
jgi:hypothetical protein